MGGGGGGARRGLGRLEPLKPCLSALDNGEAVGAVGSGGRWH